MAKSRRSYRRFPDLWATEIDGEFFVADDHSGDIHSLGQTASAVWRLLEEPRSRKDCYTVFATAFPEEDPARVKKIIGKAIRTLCRKGIIYKD